MTDSGRPATRGITPVPSTPTKARKKNPQKRTASAKSTNPSPSKEEGRRIETPNNPGPPPVSMLGGKGTLRVAAGMVHATVTRVGVDMDPRLQWLCSRSLHGRPKIPTSSTAANETAVVAKVSDLKAWEGLSEVKLGVTLGEPEANGTVLVTGRIPLGRVESVRMQPFVRSLKAARPVAPVLSETTREIGARPDILPPGNLGQGGRNVVIGIVDFGCDFAHRNFRNADGSTRLLAIWDQNGASDASSPYGYGRLYTRQNINDALTQTNPYQALGYAPPPDNAYQRGTHGTHVMDIAAGNGNGSHVAGVAPNADLIFVDLGSSDIPWEGPQVVGKSFGDSVQLLEAIRFIFDYAKDKPCVINLSLGTNGGPHDGQTLVEQGIDRLITAANNRAVVIAAANSFADGIHAAGRVPQGGWTDLEWDIAEGDSTGNEMEIWYAGRDRFAVEIIAPDGSSLAVVEPKQNRTLTAGGKLVMFVSNRVSDPNNDDNMIGIYFDPSLPAGRWRARLHGLKVSKGDFHAWIERDDPAPSAFAQPYDNSHTLGSISCGFETIVVGSYDAHKPGLPISWFSSAGPTRDGRKKPDLSAPGHDVVAAHSRTGTGVTRKSGTSMASPAVAGVVALVLAEAKANGLSLKSEQIHRILRASVQQDPPTETWDPQFGFGRVSASFAVNAIVSKTPSLKLGRRMRHAPKRSRKKAPGRR